MAVSEMAVSALDITSRPWLSIVGIGEDGVDGLSPVARQLVASAELVVGGARHLALVSDLVRGERLAWPSPIDAALPQILARRGTPVAVLASGDPFHFGIGSRLASIVARDELLCLPQPSSFALAAGRLGWSTKRGCTSTRTEQSRTNVANWRSAASGSTEVVHQRPPRCS